MYYCMQIFFFRRVFDKEKKGYVAAADLRHVMLNIGQDVTPEEIDELMKDLDKDRNGIITYEEFLSMVIGGKRDY